MIKTFAAAAFAGLAAAAQAGTVLTAPVSTAQGPVQGFVSGTFNYYLGIPYAAPPVGALRFVQPQPPAAHSGTLQALQYGSICPQAGGSGVIGSEDCLTLNIETPSSAQAGANLPVMVWIHGGGLTSGAGEIYDGSAFVRQGIVYVSINYRLGVLGFLAHPALSAENMLGPNGIGVSGNYGTEDQQAALAWVRANIANFGGNPNRVTVFGQSAGGQSTINMLVSPLTPKIAGAIIESGAYYRHYTPLATAEQNGEATAALSAINCASQTAACLRQVSPAAFVSVQGSAGSVIPGGVDIRPTVDGYVLPDQPFVLASEGKFQHVPIIDGSNHDEYRAFVSTCDLDSPTLCPPTPNLVSQFLALQFGSAMVQPILTEYPFSAYPSINYAVSALGTDYAFSCGSVLLDALFTANGAPVWSYELTDPNAVNFILPFDPNLPDLGDYHAAELGYLFQAFTNGRLSLAQQIMATGMQSYWASLARFGRPLNPRGAAWLPYQRSLHNRLSFDPPAPAMAGAVATDHKCSFWMTYILTDPINGAGLPANTPW